MSFSILSTGRGIPKRKMTNDDIAEFLDTSDEWIFSRTGIHERGICMDETLTDLSTEAAEKALKKAGVSPAELDYIICATVSGDYLSPSLACCVQQRIGASCPSFDVNAACSGFVYALDVADGYFARGRAKKILVVAAEQISRLVDWNDRSTCVLFGDGAGAVVLGEGEGLLSISLTSKGEPAVLNVPNINGNLPDRHREAPATVLSMNGQEVFKFAVNAMCKGLRNTISDAGLTEGDIDWVIPHQANTRIIDFAKSKLGIDPERFYVNIDRYGNTSAACIPIALDEMIENGMLKKGDLIAMCAFGAGLTSGSAVIKWQ